MKCPIFRAIGMLVFHSDNVMNDDIEELDEDENCIGEECMWYWKCKEPEGIEEFNFWAKDVSVGS